MEERVERLTRATSAMALLTVKERTFLIGLKRHGQPAERSALWCPLQSG
jgi:hypothetical protein